MENCESITWKTSLVYIKQAAVKAPTQRLQVTIAIHQVVNPA